VYVHGATADGGRVIMFGPDPLTEAIAALESAHG
jgi:hypothetical protein